VKIAITLDRVEVCLGQFEVLKNVTASIPEKKQTVIIGPNGGGKSTLVLTILGFMTYKGTINFTSPSPKFGYVPQRLEFDRHMPMTVLEYLSLRLTKKPLWLGTSKKVRIRIERSLEKVKAENLLCRPLGVLSGGESQRVQMAAALMTSPDILVLDEPATGVDVYGEQLLCELLDDFKNDLTVIMVSHDLATAKAHGDWIICLNRRVVAQGPAEEIFTTDILSATFGLHQGLICNYLHHDRHDSISVERPES